VSNIFVGKASILPRGNIGNFADTMKKNGYMKRDDWVRSIDEISTTLTGNIVYDKPRFFTNKEDSNVLFVNSASGGILLSGVFGASISSVIINGYQLKEFPIGNKKFSYRVSVEDGTLTEGKNTYLLEGKIGTTTSTGEVLTIYYSSDKDKLAVYRKEINDEYTARNNTPAIIAERERAKEEKKKTALALDPLYYYDKDGKPFALKVAYITGPQSTESYALAIEKTLKNLSIMTDLTPLDPKGLQEMIKSGKKNYDILIA
jgi:hypothetical protein